MSPGMPASTSQWNYASSYSRYESQSFQKLDQPPVSTKDTESTESAQDAKSTSNAAASFNVDALVDRIWSFASERISQAQSEGASDEELDAMWTAAEKGIKQGFAEAKDVLSELGEDSEELTLKIDSAYGQLMDKLEERDLNAVVAPESAGAPEKRGRAGADAVDRVIQMQQYERQTFSLDLKTAQGDTIAIRAVNENSATLEDQRFGQMSSTQWSSVERGGYSLMIKGDLNDQELEDLDALLAEVNDLAAEFYEGDYETAFSMAKDLNIDGTTLQSMNLSMSEVEQKSVGVYSEMAGEPAKLPKGLEPLQKYAEKLMQAQEKWQSRFDSASDFMKTLSNHPMNRGGLQDVASQLLLLN